MHFRSRLSPCRKYLLRGRRTIPRLGDSSDGENREYIFIRFFFFYHRQSPQCSSTVENSIYNISHGET